MRIPLSMVSCGFATRVSLDSSQDDSLRYAHPLAIFSVSFPISRKVYYNKRKRKGAKPLVLHRARNSVESGE